MINKEVTGCGDCPLANYQDEMIDWSCQHPKGTKIAIFIDYTDRNRSPITPVDCPLITGSITISIKQP